ncbi:MAG: GAF domain-containing sensor histidine kinase [Roseiflexaceae bacterium]|nr:GAF domain-containing sensor histidine kinase [Roseiflexaceae bacterium]
MIVETIGTALKLPYIALTIGSDATPLLAAYGTAPTEHVRRFPLNYQGSIIGELIAAPRVGDSVFSAADQRLLLGIAQQAGVAVHAAQTTIALQQARERLVTAREEERRRLRRDLHDGLGPRLASQTLTLDVIAKLMRSDPTRAEALIQIVYDQTQGAIAEIRELIYELRPPALDDLGLPGAIRQLSERIALSDSNLHIELHFPDSLPTLPAAVEVAAYRVAQEALTNVLKHAAATRCEVRMHFQPSDWEQQRTSLGVRTLQLAIVDNGCGIPPAHLGGVGLSSMRERAEELGGRLVVNSSSSGTHIDASLPLASRS